MKTREERRFQIMGNTVMIILTACALLPMLLLLISSLTDNDALIQNGYSFVPAKWSFYAYEYIFSTGSSVIKAYGVSIVLTIVGTSLSLA